MVAIRRGSRGLAPAPRVRSLARSVLAGLLVSACALGAGLANAPISSSAVEDALDTAKLTGLTRDALGRLLADVEVLLAPMDGERVGQPLSRVRSDASGRFRVPDLEPGVYRVIAVKGGYGVVVGQVNTVVQASLDLILYPTGREEADPASTPADAAWALRLPARDTLEEAGFTYASSLSGGDSGKAQAPARPPLHLALTHQELEDGLSPSGRGLDLDLEGALSLGDVGNVHLDVDYARVGRPAEARDETTYVSLGWIAPGGLGVDTRVDALASRHERASRSAFPEELFAQVDNYAIHAEQMRARPQGSVLLGIRAETYDAEQVLGADSGPVFVQGARHVSGSAEFGREWSAGHASRVRVEAADSQDILFSHQGAERLLVPATHGRSLAALDRVGGGSVSLSLEDRRALTGVLSGFLRAAAHAPPGTQRGLRSASTFGLVWQPLPGTQLRAEVGADWGGGDASSRQLWRLELEHADENWNVRVAHGSETGAAPWLDESGLSEPLLVTDHDGVMEIWSLETALSPDGAWWPTLELRGELYSVEGRMAARLEGDAPFAPVTADGRAEGSRLQLGITLARLGTLIELSWEGVEDTGEPGELLGGAKRYTRRGVNLRQRLGMIEWYGTNCYLLVGLVEQDVQLHANPSSEDPGRLALLDQRRFSGGLAVAF